MHVPMLDGSAQAEAHRRGLELIARSSVSLLEKASPQAFAESVVAQLAALLELPVEGMACMRSAQPPGEYRVLGAVGRFAGLQGRPVQHLADSRAARLIHQVLDQGSPAQEGGALALYAGGGDTPLDWQENMVVFVDAPGFQGPPDLQLLDVFSAHLRALLRHRALMERLRLSAYHDPLVMLPNRAHFVEQVDECLSQGTRGHMLALADIDDFSATNDVMGHRFGDRLLDAVARRLSGALPPGVLLARVGSDTFGVLGPEQLVDLPRLLECVCTPLTIDGVPHKVSLTCGYVRIPPCAQAGTDLIKDATIALKRAKRDHRGQHLQYSDHMGAEARDRAILLSDLRAAIDGAQLFLVYQPQLHLQTRALVGLEALLRWRTADGRLVAPDQFIPVAEHSGLIVPLGQWVLSTACRTMRELLDAGQAPHRMAVNVSVVQLQDRGFIGTVCAALEQWGLQGRHLELEVTESVAAVSPQLLETTLQALRADGVSIAIDDFGTGYSSLSYLERLPLDRIKIDRSFVRRLGEPQGERIAEMVVQLGRKLGLRVIAEGIEDATAWQTLLQMGCDEGQGYHIAPPMDKTRLMEWLPFGG